MNNYLAKSHPQETIAEHTDKLLVNLELLQSTYPGLLINWDMLKTACIYHDLGKMNRKFQDKLEGIKKHEDEIAHNLLSLAFLDAKQLKEKFGFSVEEISLIAQAIAYHHDRGNYKADNYDSEVDALKLEAENFNYPKAEINRINKISARYFSDNRTYGTNKSFLDYVKVKGMLNRLDYAASAGIAVETVNNFLEQGLSKLGFEWNDLQKYMLENSDKNIVAVAQTGMGKTEAGLLWIGNHKGFFTLPLKTAINEIYKRVVKDIAGIENKENVGLLHSDTFSKYIENKTDYEDIEDYYTRTKQLSLPLTICTLDQIFDFVFRYRDFEPKLATLAYSKIIIDEVQMYSPDLLAYLILGLWYIDRIGGKFAILTATLPEIVTDLMKKEQITFVQPPKPFINTLIRHSLKVIDSEIESKVIAESYVNNRVLVICNTVKKAQQIFNELRENSILKKTEVEINLLHSKFIKKDRKAKETAIMNMGKKDSDKTGIWVSTQVVEASLDIDFDLLFTELSDINGLFQRMGRCYRNREFNLEGYNCFVFNGGIHQCSGVKYVIDEQIFEFSKTALKRIDGRLTETVKLNIIGAIYTTANLKNTEYYKKVVKNIEYIQNINEYELEKSEVKERFRNIDNVTIIPEVIYNNNEDLISHLLFEINRPKLENENYKLFKENHITKIYQLKDFTVDIRNSELKGQIVTKILQAGKFEEIPVVSCSYSEDEGITIIKNKQNNNESFDARCF